MANCISCGKAIAEKDAGAVTLKDGQRVCGDCADETRILYPWRYTKVRTQSHVATFAGKETYYEDTVAGLRFDPLSEMTAEQFRAALAESRKAAEARAAQYAGAKAVIEADHVKRYFPNIGSEQNPKYSTKHKFFGVFGKIVHGQLFPGAELTVSHRDRDFSARVEEVQSWDGSSGAGAPVGKAGTGTLVCMIVRQDMSFVYPGDMLIVR